MYSPVCAAEEELACDEYVDAAAETISFCPTWMLLLVRPFHALSCATVHPCLSAIFQSTSPLFTVYVVAFAGAAVFVLLDEDDDDDEGALPPR